MLPPRYLLREAAILKLLEVDGPGRFLEIGCGGGEFLVTLGRRGWSGAGTDLSVNARAQSRTRLAEERITSVTVLDEIPVSERFQRVFLFEVLGYATDPMDLLRTCGDLLGPGGKVLLSFVRPNAGYWDRVLQGMRCFAPAEVADLAREAGLVPARTVNYGFPLANALVPVMNTVHAIRLARTSGADEGRGATETGLYHTASPMSPFALVSNRVTLAPFAWLQQAFAATSLGNGFLMEMHRP